MESYFEKLGEKFLKHINEKRNNEPIVCPICGKNKFNLVFDKNIAFNSQKFDLTKNRAYAVLICDNCSYSLFFNLISSGIIDGKTGEIIE
ncbi:hypothetical protein X274_02215 [Marinitoga sp. 1155]|nr:hypothetical protein X274_02215 [Marinitoga sp. 1155]